MIAVASTLSCGREVTGPEGGRLSRAVSLQPTLRVQSGAALVASGVDFARLRLTLGRSDGTIAYDRVVDFPSAADTLRLSVAVPLSREAPPDGERMALRVGLITSAGDTVFRNGPDTLLMEPARAGVPPTEVDVGLFYTGPGAQATRVALTPAVTDTVSGSALNFSAQAFDAQDVLVPDAPVLFTSSDTAFLRFANPRSGAATTGLRRGSVFAIASLLTGPADSASVALALPASVIAAVSGGGQTALNGTALPAPVVVFVSASDGVAIPGVTVGFVAAAGGLAADASVVTDANGLASTTWTLGTTSGVQTLSATATGLSGSPVAFTATALAGIATQLAFVTQPSTTNVGSPLGSVTVQARDVSGNLDLTFVGAVTVAIGTNPGDGTLSGTTTVNAVGGVATFAGLSVDVPAAGYTLDASAAGLTGTTSAPFTVAPILPEVPTNVRLEVTAADSIRVSWSFDPARALTQTVERCSYVGPTPCVTFSPIDLHDTFVRAWSYGGHAAGTTYRFRLRANNDAGSSAYSEIASITAGPPYAAPTGTLATTTGPTSIRLTWLDQTDNETSFRIVRCTGGACDPLAGAVVGTVPRDSTLYDDTGVPPGALYRYAVLAVNGGGVLASAPLDGHTLLPDAPFALSATTLSGSEIALLWSDGGPFETGYVIERCTGGGCSGFLPIDTVSADVVSFNDTGLSLGVTYRYRVRAINAVGASGVSNFVDVTPLSGAQIAWTNVAGGSWSTPTNWDLGRVPNAADTVTIALAGTYTVTLGTSYTGRLLTVGGGAGTQTLALTSGTLALSGPLSVQSTGALALNSATVAAPVNNAGTLTASGTSALTGALTTTAGSVLRVAALASVTEPVLTVANGFTNLGLIELTNSDGGAWAARLIVSSGTLVNAPTGTIAALAGAQATNRYINALLDNQGSIIVAVPNSAALSIDPPTDAAWENTGTISISGSRLTTFLGSGAGFTNRGTISISAGSQFTVQNGTFTQAAGATLDGAGHVLLSDLSAAIDGSMTPGSLRIGNSTASLGAGASTVGTSFDIGSSTLTGPGTLTNSAGLMSFFREGTTITAPILNEGEIRLQGSVSVSGGLTTTATSLLFIQEVGGGTNLTVASGFTNLGTINLVSTSVLNGGEKHPVALTVSSGILVNAPSGTIRSSLTSTPIAGPRTITAQIDNQGTLSVPGDSAGLLTIIGNVTTSGTVASELGGLTAGAQYGRIAVTGNLTLGGALLVTLRSGYTPVSGNTFTILTSTGATTGTFATSNLTAPLALPVTYSANAVAVGVP